MKVKLYLILVLSVFILSPLITAAECNANLSQGGNNCTVSTSLTLNGTYTFYMNGSSAGLFEPVANNIIIDCNNSLFIGNYSSSPTITQLFFSKAGGALNVTWKNCRVQNFYNGIGFRSGETSGYINNITFNKTYYSIDIYDAKNVNITNCTFIANDEMAIYLEPNSGVWQNISISGNIFLMGAIKGIRAYGVGTNTGLNIFNNTLYNWTGLGQIYAERIINFNITNNQVFLNRTPILDSRGILLKNVTNGIIENNNVSGFDSGIGTTTDYQLFYNNGTWFCGNLSSSLTFKDNKIWWNDRGMKLRGLSSSIIFNNLFENNTNGIDDYDVGLYLETCTSNINVSFNNFSKTGSTGIWGETLQGIQILNNTFDMLNDLEKNNLVINDIYDYPSAIQFTELYKSFAQTNRTGQPNPYNITFVGSLKSNNITISGNTFDSDTRTFLTLQGATNVTTDLTNYWYRKWSWIDFLADPIEYYNNINYDRLYWANYLGAPKAGSYYSWGNVTDVYKLMEVNFTKTWAYFKNIDTQVHNHTVYNLTSALIFNTNGTLYGDKNISRNNGIISFNISVNNATYVFDNANLTEGMVIENFPINITSTTSATTYKTYNITSNITDNITMKGYFTVDCSLLNNVTITPKSGVLYYPTYSCSSTTLTIYNLNLSYSNSSNIVNVLYSVVSPGGPGGGGTTDTTPTNTTTNQQTNSSTQNFLQKEVFKLGNFAITGLILLIIVGIIVIILISFK